MIVTDTLTRPLRSPEQALADSLAKARERLPAHQPATSMDGRHGVVRDVYLDEHRVMVAVMMDDNRLVREQAGYWSWSIA